MVGCHDEALKSEIPFLYLEPILVKPERGGGGVLLQKEGADATFLLVSMNIHFD